METKAKIAITDIAANGTISVLTQTYAEYDGKEIILDNHREALLPGQFDRAHEILPENMYRVLESLWTQEVIDAWEEKHPQSSEE